ncbi:Coiled-coil domain-containing protein 49 [Heterocephalus glaber]|uniref:Coiled-coil domain-containing protein 49 n=1 Tax=Heterocephalus glaber TaxID=10181 RepID=G5BK65_HETGA|nr:Coiled-coil domain-containing protein 49 [Heterocephalus glaber]
MGGGDLNLKKSWHPQTLRNVEKVWKAEQKHEAERKKIEELQRELREERAREEMQRYAEDVGAVKKKEEKLDWMYQGPGGMVNRDEYLLGRPIDKYVFEKLEEKEAGCSSETGLLPGSIFAPAGANSLLDMASKIREDPLFIIRKKEEEKKREVLNNPVKMKKIKELLQMSLEKKEKKKKKEKRKKHKKHKHRSASSSRSSSEDEPGPGRGRKKEEEKKREVLNNPVKMKKIKELLQMSLEKKEKKKKKEKRKKHKKHKHRSASSSRSSSEDEPGPGRGRSQKKETDSLPVLSKAPGYGLQVRHSAQDRGPQGPSVAQSKGAFGMNNRSRSPSSSRSPSRHSGKKSGRDRRSRSPRHSTAHSGRGSRGERAPSRSPAPKKEAHSQRRKPGYTRKLSAQELERKRQEMLENARWREEERLNTLRRHAREDERARRLEQLDSRDGKFIHRMKLESAATSSLEDRVKRNIHSLQRTSVALERNFMRR